ncbi:N-acetyl-gamma-glutamyl-phosphate reductase [Notoacmeibacter sp. MSK16QG-6]|uniref:N-acetyl-gamma-glutamyl-phosphate reductase n=1 Tax=Notoacmeibacter sp. MSK16QG-6 TaxID=2957982 RepID=UPI0020A0280B|nr:N-acetyl-gamma-glutamyl-phosphate reductase [Notoacmeibacter sp. MSK16QG-6]MCP1198437.1 N-acetyl-gamma-glutamyl-phosphate reductase [Notoacmeibacter sp. MSK16QG-6]
MAAKIFIDGEHGTTGLQIRERLAERGDLTLLSLPVEDRRDAAKRAALLQEADIAILCLPDDAAREAVSLAKGEGTRFIDASTAHRTAEDWVYGFAEMTEGQAQRIAAAEKVANVGCYAIGSVAMLRPLTEAEILPRDYPVTINAVSGYSGGGKQMIAQMEDPSRDDAITANHFAYALTLAHKHLPEIMMHGGVERKPIFTPAVGRFAQGMLVNLPLHLDLLSGKPDLATIHAALSDHYAGQEHVTVAPLGEASALPRLDAEAMTGTDELRIHVFGTDGEGQVNLVAALDNLGKGASGSAVQNLDLMLRG